MPITIDKNASENIRRGDFKKLEEENITIISRSAFLDELRIHALKGGRSKYENI